MLLLSISIGYTGGWKHHRTCWGLRWVWGLTRCSLCSIRFGAHLLQWGVRDVYRSHDPLRQRCKESHRYLWDMHRHRRDLRRVVITFTLSHDGSAAETTRTRPEQSHEAATHRLFLPLSVLSLQEGACLGCWTSATGLGGTQWCCWGSSLTLLPFTLFSWTSPVTPPWPRRQEQICRPTSTPGRK